MTYKSALAGIKYGGGKSVIIPPKNKYNRMELFKAFGKLVNSLEGNYITAIDSGTTMDDMGVVSTKTSYVTGYSQQSKCKVNPSFYTAAGVFEALQASADYEFASRDLNNLKILVKGVGNVGNYVVELATKSGASVFVTDTDSEKLSLCTRRYGVTPVIPSEAVTMNVDILCPCDVLPTITEENIDDIKAKVIVGATNNQLSSEELADELKSRNILYCPDYLANAGGLIYVTKLYEKASLDDIESYIYKIGETARNIFHLAAKENISTVKAANICADRLLQSHQKTTESA